MFSLVSRKFLAMRNIALYSVYVCKSAGDSKSLRGLFLNKKKMFIRISIVESAVLCWFSIFLFSWKTNLAEGWFHNYVCQSIKYKLHLFCICSTCAVNIKSPKMKNQRKLWVSWFQRCPLWLSKHIWAVSYTSYQMNLWTRPTWWQFFEMYIL